MAYLGGILTLQTISLILFALEIRRLNRIVVDLEIVQAEQAQQIYRLRNYYD